MLSEKRLNQLTLRIRHLRVAIGNHWHDTAYCERAGSIIRKIKAQCADN